MITMTYDEYVLEHQSQLNMAFKLHSSIGQYRSETEFYQARYKEYVNDVIEHSTHCDDEWQWLRED